MQMALRVAFGLGCPIVVKIGEVFLGHGPEHRMVRLVIDFEGGLIGGLGAGKCGLGIFADCA